MTEPPATKPHADPAPPAAAGKPGLLHCMTRDIARLSDMLRRNGENDPRFLAELQRSVKQADDRRKSIPTLTFDSALPVVGEKQAIARAIINHQVVVLCGETGSGKTTQLPKICMELGIGARGAIAHTQPRRVAARTVAARIAQEVGEAGGGLGGVVGYKIRFGDKTSPRTILRLMTDGILLAETQGDRLLSAYECVIIDEAHERSLNIDFLLGYLKQLLPKRPDLKVIITSATIDPQRFARHFGQVKEDGSVLPAPILEVSGRTYPVEVRFEPPEGEADDPDIAADDVGAALVADMPGAVVRAIDGLWRGPNADPTARGDVLVFLPTERDIRDCATALEEAMRSRAEVLPLYARLSIEEQNLVFASGQGKPRIVLATNVAETSVTVPGIRYVVDTGLARLSRYSPKLKVQRLPIERISRASADQRKGRCGRVGPGVCVRLYSEADYESRPVFTDPEILRTNLAEVILQMIALGLGQSADKGSGAIESFPFIDPPDTRQIRDGYQTLFELGAVSDQRHITPVGRELARLPTDPRLGRMILEAEKNGVVDEVLIIAAGLSVQDVRERPMEFAEKADAAHAKFKDETSDFLSILKLWEACHAKTRELSNSKFRKWCKEHFINWTRWREWTEIHRQLRDITAEQLMERRQKDGTRGNRKR